MIGSYWGAIGAAEYKRIQNKPSGELTPYECIVQGVIGVPTDATVLEPVVKARECLERLTRDEPRNAAAWAALVLVFNSQRTWGFPSPTGEVGRIEDRLYLAELAVEAANRAVEIAPNEAFVRKMWPVPRGWRASPICFASKPCARSNSTRTIRKISGRSAT